MGRNNVRKPVRWTGIGLPDRAEGQGSVCRVLFGHWGNGTRGEFIPEAKAYACAGVVSLLPDYRWERPRAWYSAIDDFEHPDLDRKTRINTVIEMRRAIDLLLTRTDVDPKRVGYVGHSFGAQWGAILAAVDPRIKVAVLMAGAAEEADLLLRSDNPRLVDLRASLPKGRLDAYLNTLADLNAINYIRFAQPTPCSYSLRISNSILIGLPWIAMPLQRLSPRRCRSTIRHTI